MLGRWRIELVKTYPENAAGPFYVQHDECITCRAPESVAPELIGFFEDPSGTGRRSHCYFKKQPETAGEIDRAVRAIQWNCWGSYRYAGSDAEVKKQLRRAGCENAIEERPHHK
jgi:hypothetical protein